MDVVVKQIPLSSFDHELVAQLTDVFYWKKLTADTHIRIEVIGQYVPKEFAQTFKSNNMELMLTIKSTEISDKQKIESICTRIFTDIILWDKNTLAELKMNQNEITCYAHLYSSLPLGTFHALEIIRQDLNNMKITRGNYEISVEEITSSRFMFLIKNVNEVLAPIILTQIKAVVKKAQEAYVVAVGKKLMEDLYEQTLIESKQNY